MNWFDWKMLQPKEIEYSIDEITGKSSILAEAPDFTSI